MCSVQEDLRLTDEREIRKRTIQLRSREIRAQRIRAVRWKTDTILFHPALNFLRDVNISVNFGRPRLAFMWFSTPRITSRSMIQLTNQIRDANSDCVDQNLKPRKPWLVRGHHWGPDLDSRHVPAILRKRAYWYRISNIRFIGAKCSNRRSLHSKLMCPPPV